MNVPTHLVGRRVGNNRIELIALLGVGSYGAVYHGLWQRGGLRKPKHCAVKVLRTNVEKHLLLCQHRELDLHARVSDGDGIVTLYETFTEGNCQFIVMKFCPDGDLWHGINKGEYLSNDSLIKNVFTQILDATEYCHSHGVYHRDIKPENILICNGGHKALLADFGLATAQPTSREMRSGSPWYMSPECWGGVYNQPDKPYASAPNDVWALGVLLVNLACGRHAPWKYAHRGDRFFNDFIEQPNLLRLFVPVSPQVHDILARIFVPDPAARISIKELKIAIKHVKYFAIPPPCRAEYHDYQRAVWVATFGVQPSSQSLLPKPTPTIPYAFEFPSPASVDKSNTAEAVQEIPLGSLQPRSPQLDLNPDIIALDTPQLIAMQVTRTHSCSLLPSSSTVSSIESDGPITPETHATILNFAVPDIPDTFDEASLHQPIITVTPLSAPQAVKNPLLTRISSWQGILDTISAM